MTYYDDPFDAFLDNIPVRTIALLDNISVKNNIKMTKIILNCPATIVFWNDHTKTVVKCDLLDKYNPYTGVAMAVAKKFLSSKQYSRMLECIATVADYDDPLFSLREDLYFKSTTIEV